MSDRQVKRVGDLDIGEDVPAVRRAWTIQRVAWVVALVVLAASLAGAFGRGPLSRATAGDRGGPLWIEYERVVRNRAPTDLRLHVRPGGDGVARVWLSREFVLANPVKQSWPEPEGVSEAAGGMVYTFEVEGDGEVLLRLQVERIGSMEARVGLAGPDGESPASPLVFTQFALP
jgi:hypothetical protein